MYYPSRRNFLAVCAAAGTGGCLQSNAEPLKPLETNVTVIDSRDRPTADNALRIANDQVGVTLRKDTVKSRSAASSIDTEAGTAVSKPIDTNPRNPIDRTESQLPIYESTNRLEVTMSGGSYGQYFIERSYNVDGTPFQIGWTVTIPSGYPIILCRLTLSNQGLTPILIDHDDADTHDGIQVLGSIGLTDEFQDGGVYRFAIDRGDHGRFGETPRFQTTPAVRYLSVYTDDIALTFGYLDGDTGPRMAVIDTDSVDLLVNETWLEPNASVSYELFGALHEEFDSVDTVAESAYNLARNWPREQLY